jgi:hypothetical protein
VLSRAGRNLVRGLVSELYLVILNHIAAGRSRVFLSTVSLSNSWLKRRLLFYCPASKQESNVDADIGALGSAVERLAPRAGEFGIVVDFEVKEYELPTLEDLVMRMAPVKSQALRRSLGRIHYGKMATSYVEERDRTLAFRHRDWSYLFDPESDDAGQLNNLAYVFLSGGQLENAEKLLVYGLTLGGDPVHECLVAMNLGVALLLRGDATAAREQFVRAGAIGSELEPENQMMACLLVARVVDGNVELEEVWEPNIVDANQLGLEVAEAIARGTSSYRDQTASDSSSDGSAAADGDGEEQRADPPSVEE